MHGTLRPGTFRFSPRGGIRVRVCMCLRACACVNFPQLFKIRRFTLTSVALMWQASRVATCRFSFIYSCTSCPSCRRRLTSRLLSNQQQV